MESGSWKGKYIHCFLFRGRNHRGGRVPRNYNTLTRCCVFSICHSRVRRGEKSHSSSASGRIKNRTRETILRTRTEDSSRKTRESPGRIRVSKNRPGMEGAEIRALKRHAIEFTRRAKVARLLAGK